MRCSVERYKNYSTLFTIKNIRFIFSLFLTEMLTVFNNSFTTYFSSIYSKLL